MKDSTVYELILGKSVRVGRIVHIDELRKSVKGWISEKELGKDCF